MGKKAIRASLNKILQSRIREVERNLKDKIVMKLDLGKGYARIEWFRCVLWMPNR